jgi:hypothetical protein
MTNEFLLLIREDLFKSLFHVRKIKDKKGKSNSGIIFIQPLPGLVGSFLIGQEPSP